MAAIDQYLAGYDLKIANPGQSQGQWRQINAGGGTYFSGLDASIYIDNLCIGEIVNIQYEVQEAYLPLFAYSDYVKSGGKHGQRRVFGSFTINFQQALLFWMILEHIREPDIAWSSKWTIVPPTVSGVRKSQSAKTSPVASPQKAALQAVANVCSKLEDATLSTKVATAQATLAGIQQGLQAYSFTALAANAQTQKKLFNWAKDEPIMDGNRGSDLLNTIAANISAQKAGPLFDTSPDGFTIGIRIGDVPDTYTGLENSNLKDAKGNLLPPQFKVNTYGAQYKDAANASYNSKDVGHFLAKLPPWTFERLTGVEITGFSRVIDDSGRPMLQNYSFVATDYIPG